MRCLDDDRPHAGEARPIASVRGPPRDRWSSSPEKAVQALPSKAAAGTDGARCWRMPSESCRRGAVVADKLVEFHEAVSSHHHCNVD
ncbi:hypothetical protein E2562_029362 [Oryza meyeriana var. granulata]|uniref:Uncharacterized protein n=1 Tax=Oryza meyeriana var. granulata TaxID=110450 RepID=A0A6G1C9K7_9ORYZ|nr:hypothetical protein E2562_029362 [Oryza meyeriana var. granulata]